MTSPLELSLYPADRVVKQLGVLLRKAGAVDDDEVATGAESPGEARGDQVRSRYVGERSAASTLGAVPLASLGCRQVERTVALKSTHDVSAIRVDDARPIVAIVLIPNSSMYRACRFRAASPVMPRAEPMSSQLAASSRRSSQTNAIS